MRTGTRSRSVGLVLYVVLLALVALSNYAIAEEISLRDRIAGRLSKSLQDATPATKKPTLAPTPRKTKAPVATRPPTKKATKAPVAKPTKKPVSTLSPIAKKTSAPKVSKSPSVKATKSPLIRATKMPAVTPTKKASLAPSTKKTLSPVLRPTKASVVPTSKKTRGPNNAPTKKPAVTKSPTATLKSSLETALSDQPSEAPTRLMVPQTLPAPDATESPAADATESPVSIEAASVPHDDVVTESPAGETIAPSTAISEGTSSPSDPVDSTASPSNADEATRSPSSSDEGATSSPSSDKDAASSSPSDSDTASPSVVGGSSASPTISPTVPSTVTTTESPSISPIVAKPLAASLEMKSNSSSPSASDGPTQSPSTAASTMVGNLTGGDMPSNLTIKSALQSSMPSSAMTVVNWTASADEQLYLVKVVGITSRAGATGLLLDLQRVCYHQLAVNESVNATFLDAAKADRDFVATIVLPMLISNKTTCDTLLKMRDADPYPKYREQLEYASASCSRAIAANEKLVEISTILTAGNVSTTLCNELLTPSVMELRQYDTQISADQVTTLNTVLAGLGIALGFILMVLHPLPKLWGSMIGFIIAASYIWAYGAFMGAYFGFGLSDASTFLSSTWWKNLYASYLVGLAAWLVFMCLTGMLYVLMTRNSWFLGMWAGIATGGVFGVQINTIGAWQLGYLTGYEPWMTLSMCIGAGAFLFLLILMIASAVKPTAGSIQHFCMIFVGTYLFIKSIGVIIGNYPNEFNMSPPSRWETYVYIGCMWLAVVAIFIIQAFVYGIFGIPPASSSNNGEYRPDASTRSSRSSANFEEEKVPLLPPPGRAAESRNMARQQEVSEFGGVRALRPDSENRRLFV